MVSAGTAGWHVCYKRRCSAEMPCPGHHQEILQRKIICPRSHGTLERGN
jgi:hypothetical protein